MPVNIYARLKPGVSIERAQAEAEARSAQLSRGPINWQPRLWRLRDFQVREVRLSLWVLLGAVGLVLLIACANTATLLLARASARQKEIAVRTSLGAGATRLVRQLLTESTLLALAGGACGVLVAVLCVRLVPLLQHQRLPGLLEQTRVDGAALAFTLALSLLTGMVFGAGPALTAPRVNVNETLKEGSRSGGGRRSRRGWNLLVVTETALALILAVGAGLLIRTFFYLRDVAPGFRVDGLMTARITPPPKKFATREQALAYWQEIMDRVRRVPGVQAATFAQSLPLTGDNFVMNWPVEGYQAARPEDYPVLRSRIVDKEYFRAMQIPLRRGRLFAEQDNRGAPKVVLVNEALVRRFWPGQEPIGKHVGGDKEPVFEVAGVVGDVPQEDTTKDALPEVYFHLLQIPPGRGALAVRADPRVYPVVRRAVEEVDPTLRVTNVAEMQRLISDRIAPKRLSAQLIGIFAGLALVLAAIGIYGVLSFSVSQRTHEIGVRVAVGAEPGVVLRMVVRQAAALAAVGIAVGIAASLGLTRVLENLLFGVSATEPWVYAGSAAALLLVAMVAAAAPAWRAARVDPLVALREE